MTTCFLLYKNNSFIARLCEMAFVNGRLRKCGIELS